MGPLKIIAVFGDIEDVITTGTALANAAAVALQPPIERLKNDIISFVPSPSFDQLNTLVTDAQSIALAAESSLGATVPEVIAFKSAVAALELELTQ